MVSKYDLKVSELCKKSLQVKWHKGCFQALSHTCPFCDDCGRQCSNCKCPIEICANGAKKGFISKLISEYDKKNTVKDLTNEDLDIMIKLFVKYIIMPMDVDSHKDN